MRLYSSFWLNLVAAAPLCLVIAQTAAAQPVIIQGGGVSSSREQTKRDADSAYRSQDYERCIELADRVLAQDSSDHVALYLRGSARVELGANQDKVELVRSGIADAREAIRIVNRVKIDYYLPYLYGMSQLAALENSPRHAETAVDVAEKILEMSKVTSSEKANIAYQRALLLNQLDKPDEALADLDRAIGYNRTHLASHMAKASLLTRIGTIDQVEKAYADAVRAFPSEPMVLNNRGMFYQSVGRNEDAVRDFDTALRINARYIDALLNRAYTRLNAGDAAAAQKDLGRAIEIAPDRALPYSLRATAHLRNKDLSEAIADYELAIAKEPNAAQIHADLGFARFYADDFDGALAAFDAALRLDKASQYLHPWRAAALIAADRRADAERDYAASIAKPASERFWPDMLVLFSLGKINDNEVLAVISGADPAQEDMQKCEAFYFMGLKARQENRGEEATAFFQQALQSQAKQLAAYRGAGFAAGDAGANP